MRACSQRKYLILQLVTSLHWLEVEIFRHAVKFQQISKLIFLEDANTMSQIKSDEQLQEQTT
jgi:hypothetical protein